MLSAKSGVMLLSAVLCAPLPSCASTPSVANVVRPKEPLASRAMGEPGMCKDSREEALPLIVDWKSSDRLRLEVAMKRGTVLVSYGCDRIDILRDCHVPGGYSFTGVSRKEETVQLVDADEVRANLPLTGFRLSTELSRGSSLDIGLVYVGQKGTARESAFRQELSGQCLGATHFVRAAHVGAFALSQGTAGKLRAAVDILGAGADGRSASEHKAMNRDGDLRACQTSKPDAVMPPEECQAAMRLELVPIREGARREAQGEGPGEADKKEGEKNEEKGERVRVLESRCPKDLVFRQGKCTRPEEGEAKLCDVKDPSDCQSQCKRGNMESCHNLGLIEEYGRVGRLPRPRDAASAYEKACAGGVLQSCVRLGGLLPRLASHRRDNAGARIHFRRACDAGLAEGCERLASERELDDDTRRTYAERACKLDASACATVVHRWPEKIDAAFYRRGCLEGRKPTVCWTWVERNKKKDPDHVAQYQAFEASCELGTAEHCVGAGTMRRDGTGVDRDERKALALLERGCQLGWNGSGCVLAAELREKEGSAEMWGLALSMRERACKGGDTSACIRAAEIAERGEGGLSKDPVRATRLYRRACKEKKEGCERLLVLDKELCVAARSPESCGALAEMTSPLPREAFERTNEDACQSGDAPSCKRLMVHYGKERRKESKRAAEMGCSFGDGELCIAAYEMRDKPEAGLHLLEVGCPDDPAFGAHLVCLRLSAEREKRKASPALVAAALERACLASFRGRLDYDTCSRAARTLETAPWVPLGRDRALKIYELQCRWAALGDGTRGTYCAEVATRLMKEDPARAREFFLPTCRPALERPLGGFISEAEQVACDYYQRAGGKLP